jgi:hypothetical protein
MKGCVHHYKGIEFVCIGELSPAQQTLLSQSSVPERIKILVDGKMMPDCILYKDYENWYTTVFKGSFALKQSIRSTSEVGAVVR